MQKDFQSSHPQPIEEMSSWSDTRLSEEAFLTDEEAFHAELPSLADYVGNWVVYFHGKRLGIFPTYTEALVKGWEIAGSSSFFAERISRSVRASLFAFFKFQR
jgi:hypothetical protein